MERPWTGARLPTSLFLALPRTHPVITWNPGEVYSIIIGFYPDALSAMTGIDLSSFAGRGVPAEEALSQPMVEACRNFFDAVPREGVERSFSLLQDEVEIMWAGVRPPGSRSPFYSDWSRGIVHRATETGFGRSTRQIARRVKSWTGITERDLQSFSHVEQLHFKAREAAQKGGVDWAGLAAESGFTDQAHMIRRIKQHTGFTPTQLGERIRLDEAFWLYRLMVQVGDQLLERQKSQ